MNDPHRHEHHIDMPTPTAWPMITAFGLALIFAGLVTSLFVSAVGLICGLFGAVGWFRDCLPHAAHEPFPIRPPGERPEAIKTSGRSVGHLQIGKHGHRSHIPIEVHPYTAGAFGGLVGGVVMAVLAMAYGLVAQGSIWYPINLLAAAGVSSLAAADLETLRSFSLIGLIVAIVSHGAISILIGLLYTTILPMLPDRKQWFWGGIIMPLIWTGLLFPVLGIIDPALSDRIDWIWFVICQVAFGMTAGFVVFKSGKIDTMQSWSMAERLGVEAHRLEEKK
ncbi:MAG: hypothetical protein WA771_01360 [Chthoniobacterales bacterium]